MILHPRIDGAGTIDLLCKHQACQLMRHRSDPRPSYQKDPTRDSGMEFGGWEVRFSVEGATLRVREIRPR